MPPTEIIPNKKPDRTYVRTRDRGGKEWWRGKSALWPERYPYAELERMSAADPQGFELMQQGNTSHGSAGLFPRGGWLYEDSVDLSRVLLRFLSLDTALTDDERNDQGGAIEVCLMDDGRVIVTHAELWRLDFPSLLRYVAVLFYARRPHYVLVEDASSGKSLCQSLLAANSGLPILPRKVKKEGAASNSKFARAMAAAPTVRSGRARLLRAPWNDAFTSQLDQFKPAAKHDEFVDCFSQAILYLIEKELLESDIALLTAAVDSGYNPNSQAGADRGPLEDPMFFEADINADFGFDGFDAIDGATGGW